MIAKRFFLLFSLFLLILTAHSIAQPKYAVKDLLQEHIKITKRPSVSGVKEQGDTTFTVYGGSSVNFMLYFVNGEKYHHILNPNPTGVYINGKEYLFYCGIEMSQRTNTSNFLDIYEFEFLKRKYICFFNFREDCILNGCRYRCYNVFDITDPKNVMPYSFSSVYGENDSFGDFNNDGILDFVRAAPKYPDKMPENEQGTKEDYCIFTAYSLQEGKMNQLKKEGSAYYLYVKGDNEELSSFAVLQADWFLAVKDTSGRDAKAVPYFPPYISFDPKNDFLYDVNGYRVEKNQWVVQVATYHELDGALDYGEELKELKLDEIYVLIDQYNRELIFRVLVGNYQSKEKAEEERLKLEKMGIEGKLLDLKLGF